MPSEPRSGLPAVFAAAAALWLFVLVAVPYASSHRDLGVAGATVATAAYLIGARICHQRPERSFHPWGVQVPVCARCLGLYVGAPLGALGAWRRLRRASVVGAAAPRRSRALLVLGVVALPTGLTVLGEAAGLMTPPDAVRAVAAVPLGAAVAAVLALAVGGVWTDSPAVRPRQA